MDENFVGYLLNALDDDDRRAVERTLAADPAARHRLNLLRRALEPLAADAAPPAPPADLWLRTMTRIERQAPPLRLAPRPVSSLASGRAWWRRADVLVAATILLALLSLVPSGLVALQRHRDRLLCQDNLRVFHQALMRYCDTHGDSLPKVEEAPPRNFAGVFVPMLYEAGLLDPKTLGAECSRRPAGLSPVRVEELAQLPPEEQRRCARLLAGGYAYVLGYCDEAGRLHGIRRDPDSGRLPIMADAPPFPAQTVGLPAGNSLNHGGTGQNVLYLGGQVSFCTQRNVGVGGDDIYLNKHNQVAAGVNRWDTVLGASAAQPLPASGE
jgi:hypothetical protein